LAKSSAGSGRVHLIVLCFRIFVQVCPFVFAFEDQLFHGKRKDTTALQQSSHIHLPLRPFPSISYWRHRLYSYHSPPWLSYSPRLQGSHHSSGGDANTTRRLSLVSLGICPGYGGGLRAPEILRRIGRRREMGPRGQGGNGPGESNVGRHASDHEQDWYVGVDDTVRDI